MIISKIMFPVEFFAKLQTGEDISSVLCLDIITLRGEFGTKV